MNDQAFNTLLEMQRLYTELTQDAVELRAFVETLERIDQRYQALSTFYQDHWLALVESDCLSEAQQHALDEAVAPNTYSILGEDTIWNTISEIHQNYLTLLKSLAQKIS
ncbi:DUF4298 domain-containing protein [Suttonella sp. R2A3]|uniref:DUF4298 domain-containing protein n=1 Tax=Suttonella sp. R2A3 TaxID=2908648 RepID=UPI001F304E42|nr:DUF4298 domain-containing protein [Suttonella sp. R2A3]UJF24367.1 DUF4298 domain-containing protein [Suttonella sp. R2A3]